MTHNGQASMISPDLIRQLREAARHPVTVRELAEIIQQRLGSGDSALPVIMGFVYAFHLPLIKALPIREWVGTDEDNGINALILPEIEKTKERWNAEVYQAATVERDASRP